MQFDRFRSTILLLAFALLVALAPAASAAPASDLESPDCTGVEAEATVGTDAVSAEAETLIVGGTVLDDAVAASSCYDCCFYCDPVRTRLPCDKYCGCDCDGAGIP